MGNWRSVVAIAVGAVLSFFLAPALGAALGNAGIHSWVVNGLTSGILGAATGAVNAAITGTDVLQGALMGLFQGTISGGVLHGLGELADATRSILDNLIHIAGHGALGGAVNVMMGEKFGDGFLSGAFGAFSSYIPGGNGSFWTRTLKASILGATGSVLGGGKFANGAYSAAFQHLFNAEMIDAIVEARASREAQIALDRQRIANEKKWHYARNKLNEDGIRRIFGDAAVDDPNYQFSHDLLDDHGFKRVADKQNMFHRFGPGNESNVKYLIQQEGLKFGTLEIIVNSNWNLVTDPMNMGTYNYGGSGWDHVWKDIVPWVKYGNTPNDPSTYQFRKTALWNSGAGGKALIWFAEL